MTDPEAVKLVDIRKTLNLSRAISINKQSLDPEYLVSRGSTDLHTFVATCNKFRPTFEDVSALIDLLLFRKAHRV